jgi:hypothetical protein
VKRKLLVAFVVASLVCPTGVALAAVAGSPNLSATLTDDTVSPGADTALQFTLSNAGRIRDGGNPQAESRVTTARAVKVTVEEGSAPLTVETGTVALGSIPDGAAVPVSALVHVDENADPGDYEVEVEVEYTYTSRVGTSRNDTSRTERTVTRSFDVDLTVARGARFEVVSASSSAAVGESGTVTLTVRNEGTRKATDATLTTRSTGAGLTFGGSPAATAALGDVAPGEERTVSLRATVAPSTTARAFALDATVAYEDDDGVPTQDRLDARVSVGPEQTFAVTRLRTVAPVGGRGDLELAVRNTGDRELTDASLTVRSSGTAVTFGGAPSTEVFVGDWAPGEVKQVTLTAAIAPGASRRSYALSIAPTYTNEAGETVRSEPLSAGVVPASEQTFSVVRRSTRVPVGDSGNVTVDIRNTGGRDLTDASVTLQSSNAAFTFGGTPTARTYVGQWAAGEVKTITVGARVAAGAERRQYAADVAVDYTFGDDREGRSSLVTGFTPAAPQEFSIVDRSTRVAVGDSGNVTVDIRNTGGRDLTDASVTLQSSNAAFTFGGTPTARTYVGQWAAGEVKTITVGARVAAGAERRQYAADVAVDYTFGDDREGRSSLVTGFTPAAPQEFSITGATVDVRVGAEGNLTGTLVNDGPGRVENAVLVLRSSSRTLSVGETEVAVDDLAPGERTRFAFELEASEEAAAGPRQFTLRLNYDDADGTSRQSDPLYVRGPVAPARDVFAVESVDARFAPGESGTLTLRVTNTGGRTVRDVSAKLFADDPLSTDDDEAFLAELPPGESTTVAFSVSVAGSALANKDYPVSVDFQYEEPDGDTKLSDTHRAPVRVTAREGGGGLFSVGPVTVSSLGAGLLSAPAGTGFAAGLGVGTVLVLALALGVLRRRR